MKLKIIIPLIILLLASVVIGINYATQTCFILNDGNVCFSYNESATGMRLNWSYLDNIPSGFTDTNETIRFNTLVGTCTNGFVMNGVSADGSRSCVQNNGSNGGNTTYYNGTGLDLVNTTFHIHNQSYINWNLAYSWGDHSTQEYLSNTSTWSGDLTGTGYDPYLNTDSVSDNEINYASVTLEDFTPGTADGDINLGNNNILNVNNITAGSITIKGCNIVGTGGGKITLC